MEPIDVKQIWKSAQKDELLNKRYSLEDIHKYRKYKSHQTSKSIRRAIIFDILYKSVVMMELLYLLIFLDYQFPYQIIVGLLMLVAISLVFVEMNFLKKLKLIKETDSVIEIIRRKLDYLSNTYNKFIFISAFTNPLFVLAGFFLYFHFKYNEIRLETPSEDPVLYLILLVAFALSFFAQQPVYRMQRKELQESINEIDDVEFASVKIEESKQRRRYLIAAFTLLILAGILILLYLII